MVRSYISSWYFFHILISMERRCPYLYTGSKFRVIWPSVLIIARGVTTTPIRKICLGKTIRRTRVNRPLAFPMFLKITLTSRSICFIIAMSAFRSPLLNLVSNKAVTDFRISKRERGKNQYEIKIIDWTCILKYYFAYFCCFAIATEQIFFESHFA